MDRLRKDAVALGAFAALVTAVLIDGSEFLRVRAISKADGRYDTEDTVIFALVVASAFAFALATLVVLSIVRTAGRKAVVAFVAMAFSPYLGALPVYWYVYRDVAPEWHINIAGEHRWAQPAALAAALVVYGLLHFASNRAQRTAAVDSLRKDAVALSVGAFAAVLTAVLIGGPKLLRVRAIANAHGHDSSEDALALGLVVASSLVVALVTLSVLSLVRNVWGKAIVVYTAMALSLVASAPVYWYVYRDDFPDIAKEHRWAPPAALAAALVVYCFFHLATTRAQRTAAEVSGTEP